MQFPTANKIFNNLKSYLISLTDLITDFNPTGLITNLFYAISSSIADAATVAKNVYDTAFISTASGDDLDKRVADFTIQRKQATFAGGTITFISSTPPDKNYVIPSQTIVRVPSTVNTVAATFSTVSEVVLQQQTIDTVVYTDGTTSYNLPSARMVANVISLTAVEATSGEDFTFVQDRDFILNTTDDFQNTIDWSFDTQPTPSSDTPPHKPADNALMTIMYTPLSIDIPILATTIGTAGNVGAFQVTECGGFPPGVDIVMNFEAISGGVDIESDAELRTRVPLYLSSLARATKDALHFAAISVDGVMFADVTESLMPTGYVTIIIDDGSGTASDALLSSVRDAIDGTVDGVDTGTEDVYRAAGIAINVIAPVVSYVDINLTVLYDPAFGNAIVTKANINKAIASYLYSLKVGSSILRSKLVDAIVSIDGIKNLALGEFFLINGISTGDVLVSATEVSRPGTITINAMVDEAAYNSAYG